MSQKRKLLSQILLKFQTDEFVELSGSRGDRRIATLIYRSGLHCLLTVACFVTVVHTPAVQT